MTDFLLHPSLSSWRLNIDCRKAVAEGAHKGDLLCQAEMISHLTIFVNYENDKNPRSTVICKKWIENVSDKLHLENFFRQLLIVNALPKKVHKKLIEIIPFDIDSRCFRLYPLQQDFLSKIDLFGLYSGPDYMYYLASINNDTKMMKKASENGSLEATVFLFRKTNENKYLERALKQGWVVEKKNIEMTDEEYLDFLSIPRIEK